MDWNKYKKYGNWDCQDKISFWDVVNEFLDEDNDNVVADVTDSYKELSSERIKEQNGSNDNV